MSNTSFIEWSGRVPLLGCLILLYKVDFTHRGCYFWRGRCLAKEDLKVTFNIVVAGASLSEFMKPKTLYKSKAAEQQQQSLDLQTCTLLFVYIAQYADDTLMSAWDWRVFWTSGESGELVKRFDFADCLFRGAPTLMGAGVKVELLWYRTVDTKWT